MSKISVLNYYICKKIMAAKFRKGVIGALLDEYQNAVNDLKKNISDINETDLKIISDHKTSNKDCVSVQSVLTHVVLCGYNYMTMIDIHKGNSDSPWPKRVFFNTIKEYNSALDRMFDHTVKTFDKVAESEMYEPDPAKKILTGWGQLYDYEQLMEHAIVHISRHRRQIQKFIQDRK